MRRTMLLVLVACGLGLAGCGIPLQSTAQPIAVPSKDKILSPATATTAPQTVSSYVQVSVYFTTEGTYVLPEMRFLKPPATLRTVVDLLLDGPETSELFAGIETALSPAVRLLSEHLANGLVTLNFNTYFYTLAGAQEVLGVAQVVDTVDADKPGVAVQFEIDSVPIEVPLETGRLDASPVRATQYAALTAPTTTSTTGAS